MQSEAYLTVEQVAELFPGERGKPIHALTVCNWIKKGVRGIRLHATRLGRRYYTTRDAVERFRLAVGGQGEAVEKIVAKHGKRPKQRVDAAESKLSRHGKSKPRKPSILDKHRKAVEASLK